MKILFVTTTLGTRGGIQRVTTVKANCFAATEGVEVGIAFTDRLGWPENAIEPLSDKVKIFDLESPFWDREPKRFDILWRFPQKALRLRSKIRNVIKAFNPDVIISTGQFEKFILPFVKPLGRKFILVREYHFASNYRQAEEFVRYGRKSWKPRLINYFENKVIAPLYDSNFLLTRQDMEENSLTGKYFDFMWNPSSFNVADKDIFERKKKIVLAAGRITKPKNFSDLIHIWAHTIHHEWTLRIIGEGEEKEELKKLSRELGVTDSVEIAGYSDNVIKEMSEASIFVGTSTFEGFMLVVVEAMSRGCVPVSYKTPYGPEEIITDGENGYLTEMYDKELFSSRLSALILNESLRKRMAHNALQRARDFAVSQICRQWINKYNKLLSKR